MSVLGKEPRQRSTSSQPCTKRFAKGGIKAGTPSDHVTDMISSGSARASTFLVAARWHHYACRVSRSGEHVCVVPSPAHAIRWDCRKNGNLRQTSDQQQPTKHVFFLENSTPPPSLDRVVHDQESKGPRDIGSLEEGETQRRGNYS